jgi:hypothetical protein
MFTVEEAADVYRMLPNGAFYSIPNTKQPIIEQVSLIDLSEKLNGI